MHRGMYRELYHGALYYGISSGENTVVHLYHGTVVPWYICNLVQLYRVVYTNAPWFIYHGIMYHGAFEVPQYIENTMVLLKYSGTQKAPQCIEMYNCTFEINHGTLQS